MKKTFAALIFLSSFTITYNTLTMLSALPNLIPNSMPSFPPREEDDSKEQRQNNNEYDFQEHLQRFKEKNKDKDYTDHPLYQQEQLHSKDPGLKPYYSSANEIIVFTWPEDRKKLIEMLEQKGAGAINEPTIDGYGGSPLYWSIMANDFAFTKFLLQHGGILNKGPQGSYIFQQDGHHLIGNARTAAMMNYLQENGEDISPLLYNRKTTNIYGRDAFEDDSIILEYIEKEKEKQRTLEETLTAKSDYNSN